MKSLGVLMRERFQSHLASHVQPGSLTSSQPVSRSTQPTSCCASLNEAVLAGRDRTSPASNSTATSAPATPSSTGLDVLSPSAASGSTSASTARSQQPHTLKPVAQQAAYPFTAKPSCEAPAQPAPAAPAPTALTAAQRTDAETAPSQAACAVMTCDELEAMFRSAIASDGDVLTRWADELARRMWAQTPTPSATPRSIGSPAYCGSSARSYGGSAASTVARNSPSGSCPASPDRRWRSQQHSRAPDLLGRLHHQHTQQHHQQHHQHTTSSHHGALNGQQLSHGRSRLGSRSCGGAAPVAASGPPTSSGMADVPDALLQTHAAPARGMVLYQGAAFPPGAAAVTPQMGHDAVGAAMPTLEAGGDATAGRSVQAVAEAPAEEPAWPVPAGSVAAAASTASTASAPWSPARRELSAQVVEEVKRRYLEGCGPHMLPVNSAAAAAAMTPRHPSALVPAAEVAPGPSAPAQQAAPAAPAPIASRATREPSLLPAAFDPACWPAAAAAPLGAFGTEPVGAHEESHAADAPASLTAMLPPPPQARPASSRFSAFSAAEAVPGAPGSAAEASVAVALLRGLRAGMPAPPPPRRRGEAAAGREGRGAETDGEGSEEDDEVWELYQQELFRQTQQEFKAEEEAAGSAASQKAPLLQPSQSSAASCASPSASSYSFGSATTSSYSRGYFALPSPCTYDSSCFPPASPHGVTEDGHVHTAASYYATPASSSFARKRSETNDGCGSRGSGSGMDGSGGSPVDKGAQEAVFGAWVSAASP